MPERPEVETVRRQLEPVLTGHRLKRVRIDDARLTRPYDPVHIAAELWDVSGNVVARHV